MEYHITESREPRGVEKAGCKIYSGVPNGQPDYGTERIRQEYYEYRVGDAQIVFRTFAEVKQAIIVNLAYFVLSEHSIPSGVVSSYSCVEASQEDKLVALWSCLNDVVKIVVELFLHFVGICVSGYASTQDGKVSGLADGNAQLHEGFADPDR